MLPEFICQSQDDLGQFALELLGTYGKKKVFAFYGEMGAGKTTLIKEICYSVFRVREIVSSPTFAIINEYSSHEGEPVYHFDFYRIKNQTEALDIGFDDYIYSGYYCFIEWPEIVEGLLPSGYVSILLEVQGDGVRKLSHFLK